MAIQLKTLIIIVVLLVGYPIGYLIGVEPKFSTKQVRELWQICSISFRTKYPGIDEKMYFPVCDCYVDHMRSLYTPKQITDNMTWEEQTTLTEELKVKCNPIIQKPITFT